MRRIGWLGCALLACTSTTGGEPLDASGTNDATILVDAGAIDAAANDRCAAGATCDGTTGLCAPAPLCTATNPCEAALVGTSRETITEPLTLPDCRTSRASRPMYDDGPPRRWTIDAIERAACVFVPPTATAAAPRPLLIYLHGSGGSADAIYDNTSLRAKAETFDLAGDGVPGFVLASHQGRNQANPNGNPPASRHEVFFRGFEGEVANADARSLDALIDALAADDRIDRQRIHLIGWSNGAFFAQQYALFRRRTPTPGGHRIASVVAFDGGDPFAAPTRELGECAYDDPPRGPLPVMLVHRSCSIVACDAAQAAALDVEPGFDIGSWATRLADELGAIVVERIVDRRGMVGACDARCDRTTATLQHVYWPDGVADRSGIDHEPAMLEFLRDHPL